MILYTLMPYDAVFPANPEMKRETKIKSAPFGYMEVSSTADGEKIERIISTDPKHYLNHGLSPGSILPK